MQKLGQYFLKNKSAIKKIIDALEIEPGDSIIEIGPGHGELTLEFRIQNVECRVIAIEKDEKLAENLESRIKNLGINNVKVIHGDALEFLKSLPKSYLLNSKSYKIVGNIPYYITGRLLRILSESIKKPEISVLTIQKEVAERICAHAKKAGCNNKARDKMNPTHNKVGDGMNPTHNFVMCGMSRLAAIVQFWAEPKILGVLPREDFDPQPQVSSAIIRLRVKRQVSGVREQLYYKTVKILFAQPRKTILNNISFGIKGLCTKKTRNIHQKTTANQKGGIAEELKKIHINPNGRPQDLSIEEIVKITQLLTS